MRVLRNKLLPLCIVVFGSVLCLSPTVVYAKTEQDAKAKGIAHYIMALVYDLQGMTDEAINSYKTSAEYKGNADVYLRLGADYARLGKLPESISALQKVLNYDEKNVQARYLLALIYSSQKDFDLAAKEYESILTSFSETDPNNIEIYISLGQLYYSQKEYRKAIAQYDLVLKLSPKNADVLFLLGTLHLDLGERPKAMDYFMRALKVDPEHDGSLNSLGYLYAEDGIQLQVAEEMVSRAIKLDPENGAYWDSLGWIYYKQGEYEKALSTFEAADTYLKDPVIYEHIGDAYYMLNQYEEAKKYWEFSLDMLPDQQRVLQKIEKLN